MSDLRHISTINPENKTLFNCSDDYFDENEKKDQDISNPSFFEKDWDKELRSSNSKFWE